MSIKRGFKTFQKDSKENWNKKTASAAEFVTVPSFLLKTYEIADDPSFNDVVGWNKTGDAFVITQQSAF